MSPPDRVEQIFTLAEVADQLRCTGLDQERDAERLFDFTRVAIGTLLVWLPPKSCFGILYCSFTSLASFSSISPNACCNDLV